MILRDSFGNASNLDSTNWSSKHRYLTTALAVVFIRCQSETINIVFIVDQKGMIINTKLGTDAAGGEATLN